MLNLQPFVEGNVVVDENGQRAFSESRRKAAGQAILCQYIMQEGISFTLTLKGPGVIKINLFPTIQASREWLQSERPFPPGNIRIRNTGTNKFAVNVYQEQIDCIPDCQKHTITLKKTTERSVLAFDIECGDVSIIITHLMYFERPLHDSQIFEEWSIHLQVVDFPDESHLKPPSPNPLSLCLISDLILSPGMSLKIQASGTQNTKDTGGYVRFWLMLQEYSNGTDLLPKRQCGKMMFVGTSSIEEWHLHVKADQVIVCNNRSETVSLDSIKADIRRSRFGLAVEMYKVLLSVSQTGTPPLFTDSLQTPLNSNGILESAPKPHNMRSPHTGRRQNTPANDNICDPCKTSKKGSNSNDYLTPQPMFTEMGVLETGFGRDSPEHFRIIGQSGVKGSLSQSPSAIMNQNEIDCQHRRHKSDVHDSANVYYRISKRSETKSHYCQIGDLSVADQKSTGHVSLDETEVKQLYQSEEDENRSRSDGVQIANGDTLTVQDATYLTGGPQPSSKEKEAPRLSEYNSKDSHYQTKVKVC